jgi:hypothetical protein
MISYFFHLVNLYFWNAISLHFHTIPQKTTYPLVKGEFLPPHGRKFLSQKLAGVFKKALRAVKIIATYRPQKERIEEK